MSEQIQQKEIERVKEISEFIDWRTVERRAVGVEKFFVVGEGLHLIKGILREDEGTVMGFFGYLNRMARTLIEEVLKGNEEKIFKKKETGVKELFERVFQKREGVSEEEWGAGLEYKGPEAFWVLVRECFEWKWKRIFGVGLKWKFLEKKIKKAKEKLWARIEEFLKPDVSEALFPLGDLDGKEARKKMLEAGISEELVEKILAGKAGLNDIVLELTRRGVDSKVIATLVARKEHREALRELFLGEKTYWKLYE